MDLVNLAHTLSFLDINDFQDFYGKISLLNLLTPRERSQILSFWLKQSFFEYKEISPEETRWLRNGELHRTHGQAVTRLSSRQIPIKEWWYKGERHRLNGPAIARFSFSEQEPDSEEWWCEGKRHRA